MATKKGFKCSINGRYRFSPYGIQDKAMNNQYTSVKSILFYWLRWLAVLPGAIICGELGWLITKLCWSFGFSFVASGINSESIIVKWNFYAVTNAALGVAFVFGASFIAPNRKTIVAIIFAILILIFSGVGLYTSIMMKEFWVTFSSIFTGIGGVVMAYLIVSNKLPFLIEKKM